MAWWRRRKPDCQGLIREALDLVAEGQRQNRTLVLVIEEQQRIIQKLIGPETRYPQTVGIKVSAP